MDHDDGRSWLPVQTCSATIRMGVSGHHPSASLVHLLTVPLLFVDGSIQVCIYPTDPPEIYLTLPREETSRHLQIIGKEPTTSSKGRKAAPVSVARFPRNSLRNRLKTKVLCVIAFLMLLVYVNQPGRTQRRAHYALVASVQLVAVAHNLLQR